MPEAYIQPREIRDLRETARERANYVEIRTKIKNKIHSCLSKTNTKHDSADLYGKAGMEFLRTLRLRKVYRRELDQYLKTLKALNEQIKEISEIIKQTAELDYDRELLMTIPGISFYSSLMIKSEIGEIDRFASSSELCAYAGLIPSFHQSADKTRFGRIAKQGSKWLRKTLVDAVTSGCRNENRISVFYQKIKRKKETGKARVAAAGKLRSIVFAMLSDKQPYQESVPVKQRWDTPLDCIAVKGAFIIQRPLSYSALFEPMQ